MMRIIIPLILTLLFSLPVVAQYNVKLKYEKELPKELFSAPTAALISYTSNQAQNNTGGKGFEQIKEEWQAYNQQLGLQIKLYADYENTDKAQLARQLNQMGISQLIFINEVDIMSHGAQDTYRLLITKFNQQASLISENQKAYALQAADFPQLMQGLSSQITLYPKGYFKKSSSKDSGYEAAMAISGEVPENEEAGKTNPQLILSPEDLQRGIGGYQGNFFFRTEGDMEYINAGFLGQKLRPYASKTPTSLRYLNKYRAAKWAFLANKVVMFGAIIGYGYEVSRDYTDYFNNRQKIYLGVVAATFLSNHFITKHTNYNFRRAVDEYNVWAETKQGQSLNRFSPSGMFLGFVPVFNQPAVAPSVSVYWNIGKP